MRVLRGLGNHGARHGDVHALVQVPVFGGNGVRVVRVCHRHSQAKRLLGRVAHVVIQVLARFEDYLFVKVQLVAAHARPGLQHRGHVVVPAGALFQFVPIHRPAVVSGVDVAGQAFLVAVQLVGAAKMHLARERRAVAQVAQVVGVGGHIGGKVGRIVKAANARGQLAAHQAKARGRAQRAVAIRRVKSHALGGELGQMRHLDDGRRVVQWQQRRGHLVGHDEQYVGAFGGGVAHRAVCEKRGRWCAGLAMVLGAARRQSAIARWGRGAGAYKRCALWPCACSKATACLSKDTKVSPPSQWPSKAITPSAKSPPAFSTSKPASTAGRLA